MKRVAEEPLDSPSDSKMQKLIIENPEHDIHLPIELLIAIARWDPVQIYPAFIQLSHCIREATIIDLLKQLPIFQASCHDPQLTLLDTLLGALISEGAEPGYYADLFMAVGDSMYSPMIKTAFLCTEPSIMHRQALLTTLSQHSDVQLIVSKPSLANLIAPHHTFIVNPMKTIYPWLMIGEKTEMNLLFLHNLTAVCIKHQMKVTLGRPQDQIYKKHENSIMVLLQEIYREPTFADALKEFSWILHDAQIFAQNRLDGSHLAMAFQLITGLRLQLDLPAFLGRVAADPLHFAKMRIASHCLGIQQVAGFDHWTPQSHVIAEYQQTLGSLIKRVLYKDYDIVIRELCPVMKLYLISFLREQHVDKIFKTLAQRLWTLEDDDLIQFHVCALGSANAYVFISQAFHEQLLSLKTDGVRFFDRFKAGHMILITVFQVSFSNDLLELLASIFASELTEIIRNPDEHNQAYASVYNQMMIDNDILRQFITETINSSPCLTYHKSVLQTIIPILDDRLYTSE